MRIGLLVGSLRKNSWNKYLAKEVEKLLDVETYNIDLSETPFYNQDLDMGEIHPAYIKLREDVKKCDAFIFITPEYNRSLAPVLKNAIDIASRGPEGNLWAGKPATVFSSTIGTMGGVSGNLALRQSFTCVDLIAMSKPEVYLSKINELFDNNGKLIEETRPFIKSACDAFVDFARKLIG
ncbi:MAG: NAD(P)H-dependent oxidoreductase [Firmicutes bacterium]|nr:NAD(P)H-dependent oxidoreductase [Bacillota bacterium]